MNGHAPAGADTLAGQVGGAVLVLAMVLIVGAFVWFLWRGAKEKA